MEQYHFFKRISFHFMCFFYFIGLFYIIFPAKYILSFTYVFTCICILILGIIYLLVPIARVFTSPNKFNQAFIDSPKFLFGIVLISSSQNQPFWASLIIGIIFISFGTLILSFKLKHLIQYKRSSKL